MNAVKQLLPEVPRYFKANLHTHSNISDGALTREEAKEAYKALGYQILCLTDHNTIANHSDMNEPDFLMLTGEEINVNAQDMSAAKGQTYHLNLIAKKPDNLWSPAMDLQCNPNSINAMIAKANEKGFLVMYNHPSDSNLQFYNWN